MVTTPEITLTSTASGLSPDFPAMICCLTSSRIWLSGLVKTLSTSIRLTMPASWPALSTTGSRLTPRSYISLAASATLAPVLVVTGGALISSAAVTALRVARPHDAVLGRVPGLAGMHDVDDYPGAKTVPGLVVYRYDAPLSFANAEDFRRRALDAVGSQAPVRWFVLNVEANVEVDFTALEAVDAVRPELARAGTVFALARVKQDLLARLESFGLVDKIGTDRLFPTLPTAIEAYQQWARQNPPGS